MKLFVLLLSSLVCHCLTSSPACRLPSYSEIEDQINSDQPVVNTVEGVDRRAEVTEIYYDCIQWEATLRHVERLVVRVKLTRNQIDQRWLFTCQANDSFQNEDVTPPGLSLTMPFNNSDSFEFKCGTCQPRDSTPCQGTKRCNLGLDRALYTLT